MAYEVALHLTSCNICVIQSGIYYLSMSLEASLCKQSHTVEMKKCPEYFFSVWKVGMIFAQMDDVETDTMRKVY